MDITLIMVDSSTALDTEFSGGRCLSYVGREGGDAGFDRLASSAPRRANPETIVLSRRAELVITTLGDIAQPWYLFVSPLNARPHEAVPLLHEAIAQLGVRRTLDAFGAEFVSSLTGYKWPRGLGEIRAASWRFGALLDRRNMSAAARLLDVSPQEMSKYIRRRRP